MHSFYNRFKNGLFISLSILISVSILKAQIPTDGMVAYYPFSGDANDGSGNGYNPVNINAALTSDRLGNSNNAYSFDGVDDLIDLGDILDDVFCKDTAQFSISGWALTNNYNPFEGNLIFGKSAGGSGPYQWSLSHNSGTFNGTVFTDYSASNYFTQQAIVNLNEWVHFVLIFDGKKAFSERTQLFINNTLASSGYIIGTPGISTENSGLHLTIGGQNYFSPAGSSYNGKVDDIRIYNRPITQNEVDALYHEGGWDIVVNNAPFADAGADQTIITENNSEVSVILDASLSSDIDGDLLTYSWSESGITLATGINPSVTLSAGIHNIYLIVDDSKGGLDTDLVVFTIRYYNDGLAAYYPFDGNANDESGNGYNAIYTNATLAADRFGNTENAFSFDGIDDYIDLGDILDNIFCKDTAQFSISGWVLTRNSNPVEGNLIIGKAAGGTGPYQWNTSHNNGIFKTHVFSDALASNYFTKQTVVNMNEWFHFVLIFDGKKSLLERAQLYINRDLITTGSTIGTPGLNTENTGLHLTIGGQNYFSSPQNLYNGLIDDIRIYTKALTKEEIDTLYNEGGWTTINHAPIANAGPDQTCIADSISGVWVNLDGSGSYDANEDTLSYTWTEKDSLLATGVKPFVLLQQGIHNIHLIVNDGKGESDIDSVVVTIHQLAHGLVAYYPFNRNANDESNNGNNAIYINAALTSDRFGIDSSAYYFDGVNNYIDFGDILDDVFCKDIAQFSISGWAKTEVMGNVYGEGNLIIGKTAGGIGPYQWSVSHNSGMLFGAIFPDSALSNYKLYYLPMNANNWFHFVLIFDGTQPAENRMRVVVNNNSGMQYWSGAGTLGTGTENTSLHMYVGGQTHYFNTLQSRYNGTIDDIRIYDRVLADKEIQNLFLERGWDPVNSEPIADAGSDQIAYIDSASFAFVTLDGSASSDEDRDTLNYTWELADSTLATGVNPTIQLPLGSHTITLIVTDKKGGLDMDQVVITVYNIPKVRVVFALNVGGPVYAGISALGDNAIYAIASGDAIYKMNTAGNVAYTIQVAGDIRSSSSIAYDTTVYIGSSDKNLYAFSKEGNSLWPPLPTGGILTATPTIDSVSNRIYIGVSNKNFIAVNRLTGTVEWNFFTDDQIWNSAVITADRKLVFATQRGTLYGFDLKNLTLPAAPSWQLILPDEAPSSIASDNEGYIYIGTGEGHLLKISLPDGQQPLIEWQTELNGSISGSPVIDGIGTIYVGSSDANLYAIDSHSGEIKWTFSTNGGIRSTPVISEAGNIYMANDIGEVISLDKDKNINWYYKISSAVVAPLTFYKSTLYIGTLGNQVIALCDAADSVQARYLLKSAAEALKKPIWATFQGNNQRTGMFSYSSTGSTEIANPHFNLPTEYSLSQNYPNPFNPSTTIQYTMPKEGRVSIKIYNIIGKHIATIVDGYQQAGYHSAVFNMDNYASGVYFYQMRTGSFTDTKKMIIMK